MIHCSVLRLTFSGKEVGAVTMFLWLEMKQQFPLGTFGFIAHILK